MTALDMALSVITAETVDVDRTVIPSYQTPEMLLISKEAFAALSDEARDLVEMITNVPDRFYTDTGQLKKAPFQRYCKRQKGWGARKVESLKFELALFCKFAMLR